jgi:hypothetical protein
MGFVRGLSPHVATPATHIGRLSVVHDIQTGASSGSPARALLSLRSTLHAGVHVADLGSTFCHDSVTSLASGNRAPPQSGIRAKRPLPAWSQSDLRLHPLASVRVSGTQTALSTRMTKPARHREPLMDWGAPRHKLTAPDRTTIGGMPGPHCFTNNMA